MQRQDGTQRWRSRLNGTRTRQGEMRGSTCLRQCRKVRSTCTRSNVKTAAFTSVTAKSFSKDGTNIVAVPVLSGPKEIAQFASLSTNAFQRVKKPLRWKKIGRRVLDANESDD